MEKVAILKEDLDDADKRADNSERQVTEEPSKAGFFIVLAAVFGVFGNFETNVMEMVKMNWLNYSIVILTPNQVVHLLKRVQEQEDVLTKYQQDFTMSCKFIDESISELKDI